MKFLNCSYFTQIMTRKPRIGNLMKVTELYPFLESAIQGDFVMMWHHMKTKNCYLISLFGWEYRIRELCIWLEISEVSVMLRCIADANPVSQFFSSCRTLVSNCVNLLKVSLNTVHTIIKGLTISSKYAGRSWQGRIGKLQYMCEVTKIII